MSGSPRTTRDRWVLGLVDGGVIFVAFAMAFRRFDAAGVVLNALGAALIGVGAIAVAGLWIERVISVRWVELARLTRVAGILFVGALVLDRVPGSPITLVSALVACAVSWVLLIVWRSIHRSWLRVNRARGRAVLRVLMVGSDARTMDVIRTFAVHPEAGMHVVGIVGSERSVRDAGYGSIFLGELSALDDVLARTPSDCAVIGSTDEIDPATLDRLLGTVADVFAVPVRGGIDARRLSTTAFASETLLHVEQSELSPVAWGVKRTFDVAIASILLVVTSPLLAALAVAIKVTDRGPVLFRQQRVGRGEEDFELLKFRTMVVDAEARQAEMQADNARAGPLFKLAVDPRVTRVGRVLRATSLDELPQLVNVVRGQMSLVGPRPALRREVDAFPSELRLRHGVRPGITGLWQVEARDNPAFDAYARLDLFYVKNWSLPLDIVIMLGTAEQLVLRPFLGRKTGEMSGLAPGPSTTVVGDLDG